MRKLKSIFRPRPRSPWNFRVTSCGLGLILNWRLKLKCLLLLNCLFSGKNRFQQLICIWTLTLINNTNMLSQSDREFTAFSQSAYQTLNPFNLSLNIFEINTAGQPSTKYNLTWHKIINKQAKNTPSLISNLFKINKEVLQCSTWYFEGKHHQFCFIETPYEL